MKKILFILVIISFHNTLPAQNFYFGADLSYVNEMEDCGVTYSENQIQKAPYTIFENNGCNLVRLRLWHTPSWYDNLNSGIRYSDLDDVKISIAKAKQNNLQVLLDFHLSDNWADPSKQLVPAAWLPIVDDLDILKDSLYQYFFNTLSELHNENLLPELIQIGNETNKGILLSPADNQVWTLDWTRNAALFNEAIKAVGDFEQQNGVDIKTVIHVAGPEDVEWLINAFNSNGVTNFDIIGLSYYWAWHMPKSIEDVGNVIKNLKTQYPNKEVMVVETGYIWTTASNDNANNIISASHTDYQPVSPETQRDWLIDLTKEVIAADGLGVIYWEPAWVSSTCSTQWGQGSHQEHATFFDFNNNLLLPGGIEWMSYDYGLTSSTEDLRKNYNIEITYDSLLKNITLKQIGTSPQKLNFSIADMAGKFLKKDSFNDFKYSFSLQNIPSGVYIVTINDDQKLLKSKKVFHQK